MRKKVNTAIMLVLVLLTCVCKVEMNENGVSFDSMMVVSAENVDYDYEIEYELNGGINNELNPSGYDKGKKVTLKNPTRSGYTFKGWYSDADFKNKITTISSKSVGDRIIYAKWAPKTYTIKFNGNGATSGTMAAMSNKDINKSYALTANKYKKKGYTFLGWSISKNGEVIFEDKEVVSAIKKSGTVTLYAQWSKNKYTVNFKSNGGSSVDAITYTVTDTKTLPKPTREGYVFAGWYTNSALTKKMTKISKGTTGNKTLYAKWTQQTYTIKFNGNSATSGKMSSLTNRKYNTTYTLTNNAFSKKGYKFAGWTYDGKTYANKAKVNNLTSKNKATVTLTAKWNIVTYDIDYNTNGGINDDNQLTYTVNDEVKFVAAERDGYSFEGWYSDINLTKKVTSIKKGSTGKVTLYAKWKKTGVSMNANALARAKALAKENKSKSEVEAQLAKEKYSTNQIAYAMNNCGANWTTNAKNRAKELLAKNTYTDSTVLVKALTSAGFTTSEANTAAEYCSSYFTAVDRAKELIAAGNATKDALTTELGKEYDSAVVDYAIRVLVASDSFEFTTTTTTPSTESTTQTPAETPAE